MLLYLQQLYQDAQETNWYTAKSAHKILLLEMERGTVSWKDSNKVHQIRARYTQRPIHPSQTEKRGVPQSQLSVASFIIMATAFTRVSIWMGTFYKNMHVHIVIRWSRDFVIIRKHLVIENI